MRPERELSERSRAVRKGREEKREGGKFPFRDSEGREREFTFPKRQVTPSQVQGEGDERFHEERGEGEGEVAREALKDKRELLSEVEAEETEMKRRNRNEEALRNAMREEEGEERSYL